MDEANTGQRSAILLDIENHLFGGLRDRDITLSLSDLTRLIAEYLEKTAASQHPVEYKYAAISLIPDDADKKIRNRRKDVWTVIRTLADMGFTVAVMQQGDDAADTALYEFGTQLKSNPDVTTYIIGTGDGAGPLYRLVYELKEAGKNVHVVAYDSTPLTMKIAEEASEQITTSLIAPHLHISSEVAEEQRKLQREQGAENETPKTEPKKKDEPSKKTLYRTAIESFNGTHTNGIASPAYQDRLLCAVSILDVAIRTSRRKEFSFGFLMEILEKDFRMVYRDADEIELKTIIYALLKSTDTFEKSRLYRLNPKSDFVEKTKRAELLKIAAMFT